MQIHSHCVTSDHGCVEKHASSRFEAFFKDSLPLQMRRNQVWIMFRWLSSIGLLQVEAGVGSAAHFHLPGLFFYQTESSSETPTLFMATKILRLSSMLRLLKYSRWGVSVNSSSDHNILIDMLTSIFWIRCHFTSFSGPREPFFTFCTVLFWFSPAPLHTHNTLKFVH